MAPFPNMIKFGPNQPTLADIHRLFEERFDRQLNIMESHSGQQDETLEDLTEKMRETGQRLAGLEQEARQPRLATEADVKSDTKTCKHMEDAATDRVMSGDSSSTQVDADPMCLASFGDDSTEPLALPCCRDDVLVDKGTAAPKPCLSPVEIRTLTADSGLLPAGTDSTATWTHQRPLWFCLAEEMNSRISTQYATTYYSF